MSKSITLTTEQAGRLKELEDVIEAGTQTFYEVGVALAEIKASKLYLHSYETFDEYVQEKWNWNKAYANHVIRAAAVVKQLP